MALAPLILKTYKIIRGCLSLYLFSHSELNCFGNECSRSKIHQTVKTRYTGRINLRGRGDKGQLASEWPCLFLAFFNMNVKDERWITGEPLVITQSQCGSWAMTNSVRAKGYDIRICAWWGWSMKRCLFFWLYLANNLLIELYWVVKTWLYFWFWYLN